MAGRTPPAPELDAVRELSKPAAVGCDNSTNVHEEAPGVAGVRSHHLPLLYAAARYAWFGKGPVSVDRWTRSAIESAKACGVP